jgi:hypothetical protein
MKGFTLVPDYCPDLSLRYQLDCDFLIADADAKSCREILAGLGYSVIAEDQHVIELKAGRESIPDMRDLYKSKPQRSVELHLSGPLPSSINADTDAPFKPVRVVELRGISVPALPASDMFVAQAVHLFRHLRSEWTRMSWLLEFRNCAAFRRDDPDFWEAVQGRVAGQPMATLALAAATSITSKAFGDCGPDAWVKRIDHMTIPSVRLWIERYGEEVMLSDYPGSKLYLLLEQQLSQGPTRSRTLGKLLPLRLPQAVTAAPGETVRERVVAAKYRWKYFWFRFRFHFAQGFRYAWQARRWKRLSRDVLQPATITSPQMTSAAGIDSGNADVRPYA